MIKLFRYYLPYTFGVVLAVLFLFIQVNMDLALPDYLSRMINVGIQQGGIEDPVPQFLGESSFEELTRVMQSEYPGIMGLLYEPLEPDDAPVTDSRYSGNVYRRIPEVEEIFSQNSESDFFAFLSRVLIRIHFSEGEVGKPVSPESTELSMSEPGPTGAGPTGPGLEDMSQEQLRLASIQAIQREYNSIGVSVRNFQNSYILRIGGMMLLFALISAMATIIVGYLGARVSAGVARDLRGDIFRKVEHFSAAEIDSFSTASLITRSTNDVTQVQQVIFLIIRMVIFAPMMGIGGVIRAMGRAPSMSWIIGLAVLILMGLVGIVMAIAIPKFKAIQKMVDRLNKIAREQLSGLMVVRAFNRQNFEAQRFDGANKELTATNLFVLRIMVVMMPMITLIMNGLSIVIIWVGADQVASSSMQVGDMMAFLQYAVQIVMSFLMLTMVFIILPRASVSANRIAEVLNTRATIHDPENPAVLPSIVPGKIEFRDVSFFYPGADDPAIRSMSFIAEPGKTTAIIGSTGSGKSTLVNLILRFYDVDSGAILVDGRDIRELSQYDLRSLMGYIPQKSVLFSGSIRSNLTYGKEDTSDEELLNAAAISQSSGFILEREGGYDSLISQGGTNVSGGQRQRLSIARALVKKPRILLFDDSFSALDFRTDTTLRRALTESAGETTKIIIAQRVATIKNADQILVLDEGKLVGKGLHRELMKDCHVYREIVISQLGEQEAL